MYAAKYKPKEKKAGRKLKDVRQHPNHIHNKPHVLIAASHHPVMESEDGK